MPEWYNPIVRSFGLYREALCVSEGLPRRRVTAAGRLDALVSPGRRQSVWATLRANGLRMPDLQLSLAARSFWLLQVVVTLCGLWLWAGRWWLPALALVPAWYVAFRASRPWAVHISPVVRTVGELTVYGTRFRDHADSGYRWSHGDVSLKVRLIVAESLGLPLEQVRPAASFAELGAC